MHSIALHEANNASDAELEERLLHNGLTSTTTATVRNWRLVVYHPCDAPSSVTDKLSM